MNKNTFLTTSGNSENTHKLMGDNSSLVTISSQRWTNEKSNSIHKNTSQSHLSDDSESEKKNVYIKCVFLRIEDINTIQETYSGLCFVRAAWREPKFDGFQRNASNVNWDTMWSPELDINNVIGEPKQQVWKELEYSSDGKCFVVEKRRVKGTFIEPMELEEFPFDVQDLSILITSDVSFDQVELQEDDWKFSKIETLGFVNESQWKLLNFVHCEPRITENEFAQTYRKPGLFFRCCVIRHSGFFVYNIMLVMAIITALSFVTFSVDRHKPENRLQLVFLLLIAGVTFKFAASRSVPQISYLTHLDRYILGSMVFLFLVAIYHGTMALISEADGFSATVDFWGFIGFINLFVLLHIVFTIQVVARGFRRRREIHRREKEYGMKDHNAKVDSLIPSNRMLKRFSTAL